LIILVINEKNPVLILDFMFRMNGMPRSHGCEEAAMFRMNGMPRSHGCEEAAMFRMNGMPRSHGCEEAAMFSTKAVS